MKLNYLLNAIFPIFLVALDAKIWLNEMSCFFPANLIAANRTF